MQQRVPRPLRFKERVFMAGFGGKTGFVAKCESLSGEQEVYASSFEELVEQARGRVGDGKGSDKPFTLVFNDFIQGEQTSSAPLVVLRGSLEDGAYKAESIAEAPVIQATGDSFQAFVDDAIVRTEKAIADGKGAFDYLNNPRIQLNLTVPL
ncbi:MAG: hypothetical protein ABH851_06840 [Methanobacteriota archaeon]